MAFVPNTIVNTAVVYPYQNRQLDTTDAGSNTVTQSAQQAALMKKVKADGTTAAVITPVAIAWPYDSAGAAPTSDPRR